MSENTPGARPVTGTGKGLILRPPLTANVPAPSYAAWASFSKPFSGSSRGKVREDVFAGRGQGRHVA